MEGGQLKLAFTGDINQWLSLNIGTDFFERRHTREHHRFADEFYNTFEFNEPIHATFAESDIYFSNNLLARVGVRSEYSWLNNSLDIGPRFSMAYKTGEKSDVSFAYGQFQQSTSTDLLRIANQVDYESSEHYILNYQYISNGKTFRIEGYNKSYRDLVKYTDLYDADGFDNSGSGYARGIDVFWRDSYSTIKNADYWISYSLLDTKRDYRDFPEMAIPKFASRHNLSATYKQFFPKLRSLFSGTYTFASGRPYNDLNTTEFNKGVTPCYSDLSITLAYMATNNIGLFFMSSNVLGRKNVFDYEFGQLKNEQGMYNYRPIMLPATRQFIFGATLTLSKNGVLNQMKSL